MRAGVVADVLRYEDVFACASAVGFAGIEVVVGREWLVLETPPGQPDDVARDISFARSIFPALRR